MRLSRILSAALLGGVLVAGAASAQEERTIRWGHLNNTDHPVSFGVQKFAEILIEAATPRNSCVRQAGWRLGIEQ